VSFSAVIRLTSLKSVPVWLLFRQFFFLKDF
jgi:hypothetical protein